MDESLRDSLDEPDTGGRIVTQNPALMSMLKENSLDKPMRRVYVDSPVFSEADDDRYKYISGDVDEYDETQEQALENSATVRGAGPKYNYKDNIAYKQSQGTRENTRTSTIHDAKRYEDRNLRSNGYSADKEDLLPETQYVVRGKPGSRFDSGSSKRSDRSQHKFIKPIESPVKPKPAADEEDAYMLEREASYQAKLQAKIKQQSDEAEKINIPRLDLVDSDDERPPRDKASMDLMLEGNIPRDSLDETDARGFRDSLDQQAPPPPAQAQNPPLGPGQHGGITPDTGMQQQNQLLQQQNMLQQQQLQLLQQQMLQAQQQQGPLLQQPVMMQPQPVMVLPNGQMVYQQQQPFLLQQPVMVPDYGHQAAQPSVPSQDPGLQDLTPEDPGYQYQQYPEDAGYDEEAYLQQYEEEMQQNLEEYLPEDGELDYPDVKDRTIMKPVPREKEPAVNYVELNKNKLKKEQQQTSYGQRFAKRKTVKAESPPVPAPRKAPPARQSPASRPPAPGTIPVKASSAGPVMEEARSPDGSLTAAEQVWAARAKSLTKQKTDKAGSRQGKAQGGKGAVPGGPGVPGRRVEARPAGVPQGFRPHHVQPIPAPSVPLAQRTMAEPISSVVDPASDRPIRHTVLTEDGQKVSVDINLKLVSPTPSNRVIPPLGPQNQQFREAVQYSPQQRPIQAFQEPTRQEYPSILSPKYRESPRDQPKNRVTFAGDDPYKTPTPVQSPYRVLPPIGSADTDQGRPEQVQYHGVPGRGAPPQGSPQHGGSPRGDNQGSYLEQLHKQKKKPEYKKYTINDYRKMKKEVRLGGLGPDLDSETLRERKEKLARQQEYARQANERNKRVQPKRTVRDPEPDLENEDVLRRRQVALEYAKSVPKPKIQKKPVGGAPVVNSSPSRASNQSDRRTSHTSAPERAVHVLSAGTERELELIDLQKLQERHERERQQVALIKSNMGQTA